MPFDLNKDLNPDQLKAVIFGSGPLLILAGAGSGKTRALTYRAAYLIRDQHADPSSILLLTFTNKAAAEMQQRLRRLVDATLPFAGTFHSFCAKLLRKYGYAVGLPPGFIIYDDADQLDLIKQIIKASDIDPKQYRPRALLSQIGSAKNELLTPKEYASMARGHFQQVVADVYVQYQDRLARAQAVDFDDLLLKVVRLLQVSPDVLTKLQHQFQYVLVDEYQDTNRAQYLIAKLIADSHHNLNAVGDASQSIYRWRGADYRNLEYLQHDFPNLTVIKLEQNYRSTQTILDAAHSVISRNTSHPILALWTQSKGGEPIRLYEALDQNDEANYVVTNLRRGTQTAVLYRTNAQSRAFEEVFIRAGIPYTLVGGVKFYQRQEIKDTLAYLRLLINPADSVSRSRLQKLGKRRLQSLEDLRAKLDLANLNTTEIFDQIFAKTGYLDRFDKNVEEDLRRIENIKELLSVATEFDHPVDFLENVALVEDNTLAKELAAPTLGSPKDAVTLMTIHSAKGLEFDQVFVVGLEEGLFPHSRSLLEPAELEEERRLCYVALTRARSTLHLTYARSRHYYGGGGSGIISRFVTDIPETLLHPLNIAFASPAHHEPSVISDELLDNFLNDTVDIDTLLNS